MMERTARPLPLKIEDIDLEWLTAALRSAAPEVALTDFKIVDINHGTTTKVRLRLGTVEEDQRGGIPPNVILKGGFEPHSPTLPFMHEQEVRFYRDLQPVLGLQAPISYFADFDVDTGQGIIIMEDLVERGVTFCDPLRPQSYEQVARRLSSLADYHAKTWNSPEIGTGGRYESLNSMLPSLPVYMQRYADPDTWHRFVRLPRGAAASVRFQDLEWAVEATDRMINFAEGLPLSVVHGDTHLGNLYEDADGSPGFFDSQPMKAPPLLEIAYHVTCAVDTADRPRWEQSLVRHYLDRLGDNGVQPPELYEAMTQFAIFQTFGYLIFLFNESQYQPEAVNTAYTARFSAAMLHHGTKELLDSV